MRRPDAPAVVVLLRGNVEVATWSLVGGGRSALALVDDLARLQLAARRHGCSIRLRDAGRELSELLELAGLDDVVTDGGRRRLQVVGKAEGGEEAGVEEVVVPDDPVA